MNEIRIEYNPHRQGKRAKMEAMIADAAAKANMTVADYKEKHVYEAKAKPLTDKDEFKLSTSLHHHSVCYDWHMSQFRPFKFPRITPFKPFTD